MQDRFDLEIERDQLGDALGQIRTLRSACARGLAGSMSEIPARIYRGVVEGVESGHCTAHIQVQDGPAGCRIVDYEAISDERGLQHIEHGLLTADAWHVAFGEAPGVTTFHASGDGLYETLGSDRCRFGSPTTVGC